MKISKTMKTINKAIKDGHTILLQEDIKKYFGRCDEEITDILQDLGCEVNVVTNTYIAHLTKTFSKEEIEREQLLEEFGNF